MCITSPPKYSYLIYYIVKKVVGTCDLVAKALAIKNTLGCYKSDRLTINRSRYRESLYHGAVKAKRKSCDSV